MIRLLTAAALMIAALGTLAHAQSTPRADQRQVNQQQRIYNGVQDGTLSPWEARRLGRGQIRSERAERRFKADGVVTPRERFRLQRRQNRQSRRIFRFRRN
ncbi:MAG: hypothetical protein AAFV19_20690 [Pseudomonadota bacterium]